MNLRPHAKTHKSPWIAQLQRRAGAVGICTSKLSEAEVLAQAGVDDITVTTVVTQDQVEQVRQLSLLTHLTVVVDDIRAVDALGAVQGRRGDALPVLVDVDVGQGRTGVPPGNALEVVEAVESAKRLRFVGLQGYEGHLQHRQPRSEREGAARRAYDTLGDLTSALASKGIAVGTVSTAGTGTCQAAIAHSTPTEIQPGSYVVMDCRYGPVVPQFETALSVLTGVVSTQRPGAYIVDAGSKTVSTDDGMPEVLGAAAGEYRIAGDEHGKVTGLPARLRPGEKLQLIPSHCDTTINLHNRYVLVTDDSTVVGELPIAARGRLT